MARNYYGVRKGRVPGVYADWDSCKKQVDKCANRYRGFDTHEEAEFFVATGHTFDNRDGLAMYDQWKHNRVTVPADGTMWGDLPIKQLPVKQPPLEQPLKRLPVVKLEGLDASQSYFSQVPNFEPDTKANFDDEFSRFASSQNIAHGSNQWRAERTNAIRHEMIFHYTQPADADDDDGIKKEDDSDLNLPDWEKEQRLQLRAYQKMCQEVNLEPLDTIEGCLANLKSVLVNIPDYIDAKRNKKPIKVWAPHEFEAFQRYTLTPGRRMNLKIASRNSGFLVALLQRLVSKNAGNIYKRRMHEAIRAREDCANRISSNNVKEIKTEQKPAAIKEEPRSPRGAPKRDIEIISIHGSESDCSSPPRAFEEDMNPFPSSSGSSSPAPRTTEEPSYEHGSLKRKMSASISGTESLQEGEAISPRDYKRSRTYGYERLVPETVKEQSS